MIRRITALAAAGALLAGGLWYGVGSAAAEPDGWPSGWSTRGWAVEASPAAVAAAERAAAAAVRRAGGRSEVLILLSGRGRGTYVDVGRSGESPGDFFLSEFRLRNRADTRMVGHAASRIDLGIDAFPISGTFLIKGRGKIEVESTVFPGKEPPVNRLAITGGTGEFKNARGVLEFFGSEDSCCLYVFQIIK